MKKIFIVMLLVIASGLWNSTNGACMVPAKSNSDLPTISVSGELYETAYPCEPGEMCPTCLTPALDTENGIYYLTTTDAEIEAQLDSLFNYLYSINCICTFPTRVTGTTYQNGSFKYININHIETDDPHSYDTKLSHYFPKGTKWINRKTERDPMTGKITSNSEGTYILSEDTLIGGKTYHKLIDEKGQLFATLREDGKKIYFRYNDIDMLLYDFGVKVGDSIVFDYSAFSASRYQTPYIVYVDRIDTITLLDGRQAKAIDYYSNGERLGPDIEYVGNDRGLIAPIVDPEVPTLLGLRHASCCSFNGEPIYEYNQGDCEELNAAAQATTWYGIKYIHEYPQTNNKPFITSIIYKLNGDTLINEVQYKKLLFTNKHDNLEDTYRGAIRQSEDRQEVYYIPSGIDKEYLLYNFDVEQGDTVYAYAGFYDASCVEMIEYEQHQSITPAWIVQDIQVIDGRKHITVQQDTHVVEWIEGIGTKHILWPVGRGCYATGMEVQFHHTLCAADNEGNTIYSFDTDYIGIRNNCPDWTVLSQESKMSSLCDEWHVLHEPFSSFSPYSTIHFALTTDTTINAQHYIKLESTEGKNTLYEGALREENKKVYFVPVGSNNEYLLYAFDAQKGEQLSNVWGGGRAEIYKNSFDAVVTDISDDTPRIFTLTLNTPEEEHYQIQWLEGIGFMDGPIGSKNIYDFAADYGVFRLLCAYKKGVQVYISKYGEEFGCEFNGIHTEDADTIPLYTGDDPGSSTIDPIDPNQVVVTLNGNELNIKESSGDEINYTLVLNKNKQAPAKEQTVQDNSFVHSVSIELTESGYYTLRLTNPNWDSSMVGHFQYINSAIEEVQSDEKCNAKILRDGQLLIRVGERLYTPTGIQIQ